MKQRTLLGALILSALVTGGLGASSAHATEVGYSRKFGLGIELGDPTGIVGKWWLSSTNALDFGIGFQRYGIGRCYYDALGVRHCEYRNYSVNADYLWQSNLVKGTVQLDWHIGVGGRIYFLNQDYNDRHDFDLSVRAPIGLDVMMKNPSFIEFFIEIVPTFYLLPAYLGMEGGLGVRFYF